MRRTSCGGGTMMPIDWFVIGITVFSVFVAFIAWLINKFVNRDNGD